MSRFIAVVHGWHVESKGFDVHELNASTAQGADDEACPLAARRDAAFDRTAYVVVEIDDREHLPRRLTWRERLTDRIK
ncbi:hypothetical protein QTN23_26695 [Pseudomonas shirazica]|uniref:hypothetical protein n=1 Tax=Pseudomonas shirazica TaxID=1940636 RepID=UPI0025A95DB1|nr:hypothetical protein [Pseudomonas shirazica]MDM9601394.1 hypothetical protein [Pseudomonas shirazica]MDM9601910.1 hypothetical protein [Pseudomonas shirazica]MDO2414779.1 hypothetical protein [Pseudomonas shirazica]MDO2416462.1 hypothetical protein [Pseudomonas shirazica]